MSRVIVAAILVVILLELAPRQEARAYTPIYLKVQAGNGLNLRATPGGAYMETMANGSITKRFGSSGNWTKVRYLATGQIGWAFTRYLVPSSAPSGGGGSTSGSGYCMTNYWGEYVCASANVADAIRYWFNSYGVGSWWGFATASCESSFHVDAWADSPPDNVYGLFEFRPSTFYPWGGTDLWDPWEQSRIAAKMFANGAGNQFYCAVLNGW